MKLAQCKSVCWMLVPSHLINTAAACVYVCVSALCVCVYVCVSALCVCVCDLYMCIWALCLCVCPKQQGQMTPEGSETR